jgi:hypothetical protein
MRTTINLDDDVFEAAKALAQSSKESIGRVVSRLARRGLAPSRTGAKRTRSGFPVFDLPADSPAVTPEMVARALEEDGPI